MKIIYWISPIIIFGGTTNEKGYKVLHPTIGCIYGDSITPERANEICSRLEKKGFASTNWVAGIGSYTYQYNTRDTFGFAMKATYVEIETCCSENCKSIKCQEGCVKFDLESRSIYKDPITDDGTKKSAKGLLYVQHDSYEGDYELIDEVSWAEENKSELKTVFKDGKLLIDQSLSEIRERLVSSNQIKELITN